MLTSLLLGIGVPTTANYVITSTIAAPALMQLGVPILAAHMFVFYFGIIADVTPPVCLAAVAASGVAKSEPMRTGFQAARLAVAAFIIPYIFVYSPQMLLINATFINVALMLVTSLVGIIAIAAALTNYFITGMAVIERLFFLFGGLFLITTNVTFNLLGLVIIGLAVFLQVKKSKKFTVAV